VIRNGKKVISERKKVNGFEDLIAWQKARELTKAIYRASSEGTFSRDFGLMNQIQRASVSIMANIAEGFERASLKEFLRFLATAKSSCAEVRSHLYVAYDIHYLTESTFKHLLNRAIEVSRIIGGLRVSLRKKL
jgi:four helix bundle protein